MCLLMAQHHWFIMTSLNGNIFHIAGPLWGESTGHWWIPLTKASDMELGVFFDLFSLMAKQTIETPVMADAITLIMAIL